MRKILLILLATVALHSYSYAEAYTPAERTELFNDITANLTCQCGCGTTVATCPHENCGHAVPMRKEVLALIDEGLQRKEIMSRLVAKHGEALLASPTFKGFNVMAWITPFAVIFIVGYLISTLIRNWTSRKAVASASAAKQPGRVAENDPYLEKMRRELGNFED